MPPFARQICQLLHQGDPYAGFDSTPYPADFVTSGNSPVFGQVIEQVRPRLIIEVGSWKGGSAIPMAGLLKAQGIDGAVVCVDTWLGGLDHLLANHGPEWDIRPFMRHGYPTLYYQFLANVVRHDLQEWIVPFPNTSVIAARWFLHQQLAAELVYVDGSHDEEDVYQDLLNYWKLLRPNGVLFGDDWHEYWHGVIRGVSRFAKETNVPVQVLGQTWAIQKPPA